MKCPKCGNNHPKKEGQKCSCGYRFIFNPGTDKGMADGKFEAIVKNASRDGTYYFTENQLYAAYCRKMSTPGCAIGCAVAITIGLVVYFVLQAMDIIDGDNIFNLILLVMAAAFWIGAGMGWFKKKPPLGKDEFHKCISRWKLGGHPLDQLITEKRLTEPPPEWREPDIYDYGVENILIVDQDLLVDLLVLNGFHTQEKALIISQHGYPEYLQPRLDQILTENPETPVYFLHATPEGEGKAYGLRRAQALVGGKDVIDLGLFQQDVKRIKSLRRLPASEFKGRIPADTMIYVGLSGILAASFAEQAAFAQVMAAADTTGAGNGDSFG